MLTYLLLPNAGFLGVLSSGECFLPTLHWPGASLCSLLSLLDHSSSFSKSPHFNLKSPDFFPLPTLLCCHLLIPGLPLIPWILGVHCHPCAPPTSLCDSTAHTDDPSILRALASLASPPPPAKDLVLSPIAAVLSYGPLVLLSLSPSSGKTTILVKSNYSPATLYLTVAGEKHNYAD